MAGRLGAGHEKREKVMQKENWIKTLFIVFMLTLLPGAFGQAVPAQAAEKAETICRMHFELHGWSAFYQTATGSGTITCENGQIAEVVLDVKGGGLTAGVTDIKDGIGRFSAVSDISEVFGAYAKAEAHAGVAKSATAQIMTKGTVSLALSGVGEGVNLGIDFGRFTITPKK
jgi:hypothetical protein